MEESIMISTTNYMSKVVCSSSEHDDDDESGWTFYLDDFKAAYPCGSQEENDSLLTSGSMASEAASSAASKKQRFDSDEERSRRTSAKRRKTRAVFVDHDLEDTASSPDHTPKANDFNQLLMNTKEMIGSKGVFQAHNLFQRLNKQPNDGVCIGISQGKENRSDEKNGEEIQLVGKESYYTELRRKGLCLVPVSMIFNCV